MNIKRKQRKKNKYSLNPGPSLEVLYTQIHSLHCRRSACFNDLEIILNSAKVCQPFYNYEKMSLGRI